MEPEAEDRMRENIERIEAYTRERQDLTRSHHFLYDLRVPKGCRAEFVVMGINPGESRRFCEHHPGPTEETSRFDWIEAAGFNRAGVPWSERCEFYLGGAPYVMTELFFWSSLNIRELNGRLGGPLAKSEHLPFCRDMNVALIDTHRPRAVVVVGLGAARLCRELFRLQHHRTVQHGDVRVAEKYADRDGRPWLVNKHWTNGWGLTTGQRDAIQEAIRLLC